MGKISSKDVTYTEMKKNSLTLHIGMSKTGTTFLQQRFFPLLPGIDFKDQPRTKLLNGGPYQGLLARAFKRSPALWADLGNELFTDLIGGKNLSGTGNPLLISDQSAGPALFEPGNYGGPQLERERNRTDQLCSHLQSFSEIAKKRGASSVRVILIFRRQDEWLASKYAQRSDRIHNASQKHFESRIRSVIAPADGYYTDGITLNYHYLLQQLIQSVGKENLLMLPYEMFKHAPSKYLATLARFITSLRDAEINRVIDSVELRQTNVRSVSVNTWQLRRNTGSSVPTLRLRPGRLFQKLGLPHRVTLTLDAIIPKGDIFLSPELRKEIMGRYTETNRRLAESMKMDLGQYGYY